MSEPNFGEHKKYVVLKFIEHSNYKWPSRKLFLFAQILPKPSSQIISLSNIHDVLWKGVTSDILMDKKTINARRWWYISLFSPN